MLNYLISLILLSKYLHKYFPYVLFIYMSVTTKNSVSSYSYIDLWTHSILPTSGL